MPITRTPWIDDDGSGTTGTVINNAEKTLLYNQIDAALTSAGGPIVTAWTPVIGGDGGESGQTYSKQQGAAFKLGPLVIAPFEVTLSVKGTVTGNAILKGLPYAPAANHAVPITYFISVGTTAVSMSGYIVGTVVYLSTGAAAAGGSMGNVSATELTNTTRLSGVLIYQTAA